MEIVNCSIYNDKKETEEIFKFLDNLEIEYHKEYKVFGKIRKVPRGQASFTLDKEIHYNYKVAGGSPINVVMCDKLKEITTRVNKTLNTNFNSILLNKYKDGLDYISYHKDKTDGWKEGTGVATLSFGCERDFNIKCIETQKVTKILHKDGSVLYMPYPMNDHYQHSVPKRVKCKDCRISLTFREMATEKVKEKI